MKKFSISVQDFLADESGATAIEYGLLAGLISVIIVPNVSALGARLNAIFGAVTAAI